MREAFLAQTNGAAEPLPKTTEVAVIGGGIVGCATAYYLAKAGVPVVLLEKGRIAGEQSSRNWGWVRKQGRDPAELPAIIESLRLWEGLEAELEADLGWHRSGVAYLAKDDADLARYEAWLAEAKDYQLDSRLLSAAEADALLGEEGRRWKGALYTPSDGRAEPAKAAPALARKAEALGAGVFAGCAARTVETAAGRVSGIVTERGRIACRAVVCAAGVWTRLFSGNLGLTVPQLRVKASALRSKPAPLVTESAVWSGEVSFRRRQDGGYTIAKGGAVTFDVVPDAFRLFHQFLPALKTTRGSVKVRLGVEFLRQLRMPKRWDGDTVTPFEKQRVLDPAPDPVVLEGAIAAAQRLFPKLGALEVAESWAGMIETTPDELPVFCEAEAPKGYFLATGLSGHGFGMGPAAGLLMAELITKGKARVDLRPWPDSPVARK